MRMANSRWIAQMIDQTRGYSTAVAPMMLAAEMTCGPSGCFRERCDRLKVTAVLDTRPPMMPETSVPLEEPRTLLSK